MHITTTDTLRNAAFAIAQEAKRLRGDGLTASPLSRELTNLSEFLAQAAGDDSAGNQSCALSISF